MPTYQYSCTKCGHDLEARQGFSDDPLTDCPTCQRPGALRKQFGSVGVVFKGSGFYRNDSRSTSSTELSKNDSQTSDNGNNKSETTSESKSESKTETKSESKSDTSSSSSESKPAAKKKDTAAA